MKIKSCPSVKRGSILAYSLIVISMMLSIAAAVSITTIVQKKSASSTDFSVQAYQTADSGVQLAIKEINTHLSDNLVTAFPACDIDTGTVKDLSDAPPGKYTLSFFDSSDVQIDICSAAVNTIYSVKSVGKYQDTVRAVSVVVGVPSCNASTVCGQQCSFNGLTYGTVTVAGECWFDRNLGATRVATAVNDVSAYGWLFQWGRLANDHQTRTSTPLAGTIASIAVDVATGGKFMTGSNDWLTTFDDTLWQSHKNDPCPAGFHVPLQAEWVAVITAAPAITNMSDGYSSLLKLTSVGYRDTNVSADIRDPSKGYYWSGTPKISSNKAKAIQLDLGIVTDKEFERAKGAAVRCIKN